MDKDIIVQTAAQVRETSASAEESNIPSETQQIRSSSRKGSLTKKGLEMRNQESKKHEKAFNMAYDSWKQLAKETRSTLKTFCSGEDLDQIQRDVQNRQDIQVLLKKVAYCELA